MRAATLIHLVGVMEMIAGTIVLRRWTKVGGCIVMVWLIVALLQLTAVREEYAPAVRQEDSGMDPQFVGTR